MSRKILESEMIGKKFSKLTVVKEVETRNGRRYFLCKCDCGKEKEIMMTHLNNGSTKSCGCILKEFIKEKLKKHNGKGTSLYNRWKCMNQRCSNPNNPSYKNYGGRGIDVCELWKNSYAEYEKWANENGYKNDLEIDRIDNNKGYSPDNCRIVTVKINSRNKRNTVFIDDISFQELIEKYSLSTRIQSFYYEYKKKTGVPPTLEVLLEKENNKFEEISIEGKTLKKISVENQISYNLILNRFHRLIERGLEVTIENILNYNPKETAILFTKEGKKLMELSKETKIPYGTLSQRYHKFSKQHKILPTAEELLKMPKKEYKFKVSTEDGYSLKQLALKLNLSRSGVEKRFRKLSKKLKRLPTSKEVENYMLIPR